MHIILYIIRHGQSKDNLNKIIQGQTDSPLTELGKEQAECAAKRLSFTEFSGIYSSDLERALETAEIIASYQKCKVTPSKLIRESYMGLAQGLTQEQFAEKYPKEYEMWLCDSINNRPPQAESIVDIIARCSQFVEEIKKNHKDGDNVLAVCHGGSLRGLICAACGFDPNFFSKLRCFNAGLCIVHIGDRVSLTLFNDTSHLRGITRTDVDSLQFSVSK